MFSNLSEKYKSILEHRIDLEFFQYHNIYFWSLEFDQIDDFNIQNFANKKNILILNEEVKEIKNLEKFRSLISSCYLFSRHNFLTLFGIPESTFYFNCLIDDLDYFISNNNDRNGELIYDEDLNYSSQVFNDADKFIINNEFENVKDKNRFFYYVVCALSCGCSVFIQDLNLLNIFDSEDSYFVNKSLTQSDKLKSQEHFHFKYGYTYQSWRIKNQLVGILGEKFDLEASI